MCSQKVTAELSIEAIGHRGDGIARGESGNGIYVPFTLPGERILAEISGARGDLVEVIEPSSDRISPVCALFETCGGCLLQHMAPAPYLEFKRQIIVNALKSHGLEHPVETPVAIPTASRRRAVFSAKWLKTGRLLFGFAERRSHAIVDIETCPILLPSLDKRLSGLRSLAAIACGTKKVLKVQATLTPTGLDVVFIDGKQDEKTRQRLAREALGLDIARVSFPSDIIIESSIPSLHIDGTTLQPKPGTFLQAATESEDILARYAVEAVKQGGAKTVADLFCGIGAFALRLARFAKVTGIDSDADALASLDHALRFSTGLKPVRAERRDLFRNPMTARELNLFDAVLFDPPRAGAERQAHELARSKVKSVVAISCNPLTLARDLAILADGGYRIRTIRPVDQFVFSTHIETIAVCDRED